MIYVVLSSFLVIFSSVLMISSGDCVKIKRAVAQYGLAQVINYGRSQGLSEIQIAAIRRRCSV